MLHLAIQLQNETLKLKFSTTSFVPIETNVSEKFITYLFQGDAYVVVVIILLPQSPEHGSDYIVQRKSDSLFIYTIGLKLSKFKKFNIKFSFLLTINKLIFWYAKKAYFDAILCFIHDSCMSQIRSSIAELSEKLPSLH